MCLSRIKTTLSHTPPQPPHPFTPPTSLFVPECECDVYAYVAFCIQYAVLVSSPDVLSRFSIVTFGKKVWLSKPSSHVCFSLHASANVQSLHNLGVKRHGSCLLEHRYMLTLHFTDSPHISNILP